MPFFNVKCKVVHCINSIQKFCNMMGRKSVLCTTAIWYYYMVLIVHMHITSLQDNNIAHEREVKWVMLEFTESGLINIAFET